MKKQYFPFIILLSILSACSDNSDFDATGTFEATEIIVSAESNVNYSVLMLKKVSILHKEKKSDS